MKNQQLLSHVGFSVQGLSDIHVQEKMTPSTNKTNTTGKTYYSHLSLSLYYALFYSSHCLYHIVQNLGSFEPHSILLIFRKHFADMLRHSNKKRKSRSPWPASSSCTKLHMQLIYIPLLLISFHMNALLYLVKHNCTTLK